MLGARGITPGSFVEVRVVSGKGHCRNPPLHWKVHQDVIERLGVSFEDIGIPFLGRNELDQIQ